jgi:hypothetical protein
MLAQNVADKLKMSQNVENEYKMLSNNIADKIKMCQNLEK